MEKLKHLKNQGGATSNRVRFFTCFLLAGVLLVAQPAAAQVSYQTFDADITINQDASISVMETVVVHFDEARHGIFRVIPYRYELGDGKVGSIPVTVTGVLQDSRQGKFAVTADDSKVTIKIGDPDVTITGAHTYVITYTAQAAVNFFTNDDELYWNVTGHDWPAQFQAVTAIVHFPTVFEISAIRTDCYTGPVKSQAHDCQMTHDTTTTRFTSRDFLTVVVGWPTGAVVKPAGYDQLRQGTNQTPVSPWPMIVLWLNFLLPVATAFGVWAYWRRHGQDPADRRTIIPHYDPPPGLTPGEMGVLFDERANHHDVVATVIDLAVRGYLDITEVEKPKALGLGHARDYLLTRKNDDPAGLRRHEQDLMAALFTTDSVRLSDLKGTFADDVKLIQHDLYQQVAAAGYFQSNPETARKTLLAVGGGMILISWFAIPVLFGVLLAGVVLMIFSKFMPKRTDTGVEALWQAKGFKLFLEKAEQYRLQWQEREHIFEKFLPYAMALGVAKAWSQAFAGLHQPPPSWYHGSNTLNTVVLWTALSDFSAVSARSFSPPAASGTSGFGGGGFSGGGGGGGGGGSW